MSFHRNHGGDELRDGVRYSNKGTSEVVMRSQFLAWKDYLAPALAAQPQP